MPTETTLTALLPALSAIWTDILGRPISLSPETPFRSRDWDSLALVQFIVAIEDQYRIRIPVGEAAAFVTLQDVVDSIQNHLSG